MCSNDFFSLDVETIVILYKSSHFPIYPRIYFELDGTCSKMLTKRDVFCSVLLLCWCFGLDISFRTERVFGPLSSD